MRAAAAPTAVRRAEDSMDQLTRHICHMRVHIQLHQAADIRALLWLERAAPDASAFAALLLALFRLSFGLCALDRVARRRRRRHPPRTSGPDAAQRGRARLAAIVAVRWAWAWGCSQLRRVCSDGAVPGDPCQSHGPRRRSAPLARATDRRARRHASGAASARMCAGGGAPSSGRRCGRRAAWTAER